jgi:hypothetical protein
MEEEEIRSEEEEKWKRMRLGEDGNINKRIQVPTSIE